MLKVPHATQWMKDTLGSINSNMFAFPYWPLSRMGGHATSVLSTCKKSSKTTFSISRGIIRMADWVIMMRRAKTLTTNSSVRSQNFYYDSVSLIELESALSRSDFLQRPVPIAVCLITGVAVTHTTHLCSLQQKERQWGLHRQECLDLNPFSWFFLESRRLCTSLF